MDEIAGVDSCVALFCLEFMSIDKCQNYIFSAGVPNVSIAELEVLTMADLVYLLIEALVHLT